MPRLRPFVLLLPFIPLSTALAGPLSETEAMRAAIDSHASIESARSALTAAQGLQDEADFLLPGNPAIRIERTTDRWHHNNGDRETVAEISAPIWMPGQMSGRQAVAAAKRTEAEADIVTAKWALAGAVREAYWKAWEAKELLRAAEERLDRSKSLHAAAEKQVRAKEMRELDARTVAGEVLSDRQVVSRRKGEYETALAVLAELTGLAKETLGDLAVPVPASPPPQLAADVEGSRPDLKVLRSRLEGGRANFDLQQARALPNPELSLAVKRTSTDYDRTYDDSVVFGIKMPIPVIDRNQREVMAATADISRNRAEYQLAVNKARRELIQAESGWRVAWQQWQDAEEALQLTSETLALIEKGFTVGEVSSVDLIQEKRRWGEAVEADRSAAAAVAIAKAAWEQAAGASPIPVQ
jgi:cobalt-zinc-cadmium efflux system outer membrane protein